MATKGGHDPRRAIAAGRALLGQTQEELAKALTRATDVAWSRRMVAALEIGEKALRVDVLMAIAQIQGLPYSFYLEGVRGSQAKGVLLASGLAPRALATTAA